MPGRICEISGDRLVRDLEVALEPRQVEKVSAQRRRLRRGEAVETWENPRLCGGRRRAVRAAASLHAAEAALRGAAWALGSHQAGEWGGGRRVFHTGCGTGAQSN